MSQSQPLVLSVLPDKLAVCRLDPGAELPRWAQAGAFVCVTRTPDELSVVCAQELPPAGTLCENGWRALKVRGPLDFALVGVLASIARPLADAGISIFAVSTFDTDYILVRDAALFEAVRVLEQTGHTIE